MSNLQERLRDRARAESQRVGYPPEQLEEWQAADALDAMEKALRELVAANNCNYDRDAMRYAGMFKRAEAAVAKLES